MNLFKRPQPAIAAPDLRTQLVAARDLTAVQREDIRERRAQQALHRIDLADVDEQATAADRARRERARDAAEDTALADLYRHATRSGARARIRAEMQGSAEMRALRVAKVRQVTLAAGIPVLAAFAAWSTTGVQAGVVRMLDLDHASAGWWASWGVEPALIAVVGLIIIGRAVLRSSGGDTDWRATTAEWIALSLSLVLNVIGGWHGTGWSALGAALAHSIGPIGAAGTAFLIGVFDSYVSAARPWAGAPRLADLHLAAPPPVTQPWRTTTQDGDAPLTQISDAPVDAPPAAPAQPAPPAVTHVLAHAPKRHSRGVVMVRPVSAPPADRDMRHAIARVLAQTAPLRQVAREEGIPESTLRREVNKVRTDAGVGAETNGHNHNGGN